jgi:ADP-ribosyl-[dinitrogen reductase] hydrolase
MSLTDALSVDRPWLIGHSGGDRCGRGLFERLLAEGRLAIAPSALFDSQPPALQGPITPDRVRGMLLGIAIGDALGNTSESLWPGLRRLCLGEIRSYLPNWRALGRRVGLPSDDTQLAFWTVEQLVEDGRLDVDKLARRFSTRPVSGMGRSVRRFRRNMGAGLPWPEAAARSAGNGALMRIAPVLLPHLSRPSPDLWVDGALAAAITHNDPASIAASVAFVGTLWQLLGMRAVPPAHWWVDSYIAYAKSLEGDTRYRARRGLMGRRSRTAPAPPFEGPVWQFVEERLPVALRKGDSAAALARRWNSSAYLLETVPLALFILARHADDPEEAIVRAVNDTYDNDTIGAIVGAAMGALHGEAALPQRWRENLLGRTTAADDGRVFELMAAAERFVP